VTPLSLGSITGGVLKLKQNLDGLTTPMRKDTKMKNLMRKFNLLLTLIGTMLLSTVVAQASTYTVTNNKDSGQGSLRQAITDANNQVGSDVIHFNIPGGGVHTITLLSPLDVISGTVDIDGYTQPGASPNTLAQGDDAVLLIEITTLNGAANSILNIAAPNCNIRGLVLNRSGEDGIYIGSGGSGTAIAGNFIGTDATGLTPRPNGKNGIHIEGSNNNLIGGNAPFARNIISGNALLNYNGAGVLVSGVFAANNKIQGNFIGTNKNGTAAINNHQMGVMMDSQANNNTVGGTTAGERNIISGNATFGVYVFNSNFNLIEGNYIGTDVTGNLKVANSLDGIDINGDCFFNKIGDAGAGNVISGNNYDGIDIVGNQGKLPHVNQVVGNFIGTKADGISPLGNGIDGVRILSGALNNIIGTSGSGGRNVIAFNGADPGFSTGSGITLVSAGSGNLISSNSIYSNKTLGIDLTIQGYGVTPNDPPDALDGDAGPNDLQNYPVIDHAYYSAKTGTQIAYSLNSTANTKYTVELFVSDQCGASGYGEGQTLLSSFPFTTDKNGYAAAGVGTAVSYLNKYVTATATDSNGSTSEFSKCMQVAVPQPGSFSFSIANYSVNENGGVANITVQRTGGSAGAASVEYATVGGGTATAGSDYASTNGTISWSDGDSFERTFSVAITNDALNETNETINLALSNPQGGVTLGNQSTATLTILDNDAPPAISINDVSAAEGNSGSTSFNFNVNLSAVSGQPVTVNYATMVGGTATQGNDYQPANGQLTFAPGETTKPVTVLVSGDTDEEPDETFFLQLSNPANATLGKTQGTGAIVNDDAAATPTPTPTPSATPTPDPTATPTPTPTATPTPLPTPGTTPGISISDVSLSEGNGGTTSFDFNVTLSTASDQTVTVDYVTADGTAIVGSDYQPASGTLTFGPGDTSKTVSVLVSGDPTDEPNETFVINLSNPAKATITKAQGTGTIINDDAPAAGPAFDFSQATYSAAEQLGVVTLTVIRSGDTSGPASVDYATADGSATQKGDFEIAAGTLNFGSGQSSRMIQILLNQDAHIEGPESFSIVLSNPSGAALGVQAVSQVNISDDLPEQLTSPIDDPQSFVYMHYHDFLNREPDAAGLQFWTNEITGCGQDAKCIDTKRTNVSAAFFLSVEFQQTGYLLYLFQKESFGSLPKYQSFMRDLQEVSQGVVVNAPGWEQKLAANQQQFAEAWVTRTEFKAAYDAMSNADFVNSLYAHAGVVAPQAERDGLVTALDTATQTRAAVLLEVANNAAFQRQEESAAFVLTQYFGYLRRDPDSGPDSDLSGYNFWLNKLNQFNGDYRQAEMVKAFLVSGEYRARFGPQ